MLSNNGNNGTGSGVHKPKRSYSESDKATALVLLEANGGNVRKTSRETGIPAATLAKWDNGKGITEDVVIKCAVKRDELGVLFDQVARLYLAQAMSADAISATKGKDAVIAAATATDKVQLLKGEATNITKDVTKSNEERAERVMGVLSLVKKTA